MWNSADNKILTFIFFKYEKSIITMYVKAKSTM